MEPSVDKVQTFSYPVISPRDEGTDVLNVNVTIGTSWQLQDLEEAKKKRTSQDEWETNNRTIDGIDQRLEDFAQSEKTLKETISNFIKAEAALQGR